MPIPEEEWAIDLGRVDEGTKRAVLAKATALVQLSLQESLSLVALEAWAEGTPVIVHKQCPVLAWARCGGSGGGWAVDDYMPIFPRSSMTFGRIPKPRTSVASEDETSNT